MFILTETQRRHWTAHGWLLLSQGLAPEAVLALSSWVEEMAVEGGGIRISGCSTTSAPRGEHRCAEWSAFWTIISNSDR
jgi:hypothetical protein